MFSGTCAKCCANSAVVRLVDDWILRIGFSEEDFPLNDTNIGWEPDEEGVEQLDCALANDIAFCITGSSELDVLLFPSLTWIDAILNIKLIYTCFA